MDVNHGRDPVAWLADDGSPSHGIPSLLVNNHEVTTEGLNTEYLSPTPPEAGVKDKNREGRTSNPIPNDHESHNENEIEANASDRKSEATPATGLSEASLNERCADETHET